RCSSASGEWKSLCIRWPPPAPRRRPAGHPRTASKTVCRSCLRFLDLGRASGLGRRQIAERRKQRAEPVAVAAPAFDGAREDRLADLGFGESRDRPLALVELQAAVFPA